PSLSGAFFPNAIGSALFEQERKRKGGAIDIQFRPIDDLTFNIDGFYSHLDADNFNRNYLVWVTHVLNGGAGQAPDPGFVAHNGTLVQANWSVIPGHQYAIYDQFNRPGSESESKFITLDGEWRASDKLTFTGKVGDTKGSGTTPAQATFEADI